MSDNAIVVTWLGLGIVVTVLFLSGVLYIKEDPEPQTSSAALCEVGTKHPDGSVTINESNPGEYEYIALATSDGIKIFTTNCNE